MIGTTQSWKTHAACRDEDPELFFPIGNTGPALLQIEDAKAVCRRCPSLGACADWVDQTNPEFGVWAGTSEEDRGRAKRRDARRRQRAAARSGGVS